MSQLTIHCVEAGQGASGCTGPNVVQIKFRENTSASDSPETHYLRNLLEGAGYQTKEGQPIAGTPVRVLCVFRDGSPMLPADILQVLRGDKAIDVSLAESTEGS